ADAVDRVARAQRQRRHVEHRAAAVVVVPEREEAFAVRAEIAPGAGQMRLDEMKRKRVVTSGHRCVRCEDGGATNLLERAVEARAGLAQIANALQHDECRVPLVEMVDRRRYAHRLQNANAADAENDLLLHARLAIAAVEARRELAIPWRVLFEIGVEKIER